MKWSAIIFFLTVSTWAIAQIDPIDKSGLAIGGYDVVAYFESGKPEMGNSNFKSIYEGATYYFVSAERKKLFEANPAKYLPQYNGYCALAVSYGKKVSIDPETFKVSDNKLYLFYHGKTSRGRVNSIETWNKSEDRLLKKAEALWPEVKKVKYKSGTGL
jgi:YHS domain-containing protein